MVFESQGCSTWERRESVALRIVVADPEDLPFWLLRYRPAVLRTAGLGSTGQTPPSSEQNPAYRGDRTPYLHVPHLLDTKSKE